MLSGVYALHNTTNDHCYVGSSKDLRGRVASHFKDLRSEKHYNPYLQRAFIKYGEAAFRAVVLAECREDDLLGFEQWYMDLLKPEYNIAKDATSPSRGRTWVGKPLSPERRQRLSVAHQGLRWSDQHRQTHRTSIAVKAGASRRAKLAWTKSRDRLLASMRGRTLSVVTKQRMSVAQKARYLRPGVRERQVEIIRSMHAADKGASHEALSAGVSASWKDGKRTWSPVAIAAMAKANRGRKMSPEAVAKSRIARLGKKRTPEQCARMKEGHAQAKLRANGAVTHA